MVSIIYGNLSIRTFSQITIEGNSTIKATSQQLDDSLHPFGFTLSETVETGFIYHHSSRSICLKIDKDICRLNRYQYIDYTRLQNKLVSECNMFLRFNLHTDFTIKDMLHELALFTDNLASDEDIKRYGGNRQEQEIDPTLPEATFETCFAETFGEKSLYALTREYEYYDYDNKRRYVDYLLKTKSQNFAIELNGESFHHPCVIKEKRYASQLFKQNSLAAEGYKVFRWSLRAMRDNEKFTQDMNNFFGDPNEFDNKPKFTALRTLKTFVLAEHQQDSLEYINELRKKGQNTVIIVLPTASGKTEIFIKDFSQLHKNNPNIKGLVLVPRKRLTSQTIERFKQRSPKIEVSEDFNFSSNQNVCVQTYAYILRHYHKKTPLDFDYIVVDEAHHAQANGLKRVLEYYQPKYLLGFTATDERLDQRRLDEIFGQYKTQLDLKEAMKQGIIPPISVFRLKTNIDLSQVRFNGKDFVKSDLQKTIQVPSRDQLIIDIIKKSFINVGSKELSHKQGVVFCVNIAHAKRIAKLFNDENIKAAAVSGKERAASDKAIIDYKNGDIQFLCSCDLLNEGWDSPQTSILVMARPTMSKVVYTQQLGRGTRHCKGKERLYVIDVVDSYGAQLQPYSLHGMLGLKNYMPFADVLNSQQKNLEFGQLNHELLILSGLFEQEVEMIPVDVFTLREQLADYLNVERLARELFVSTGTINSWIRKKQIIPDSELPFGSRKLYFFKPESVNAIRKLKGLKKHTKETSHEDFFNFLQERDYTYSYKIVFLSLMLKLANPRGEVNLTELTNSFTNFYSQLHSEFDTVEKKGSPFNNRDFLKETDAVQRNILQNPFEKFERKRFMHHCKDLNYISFESYLWSKFDEKDFLKIKQQMLEDLVNYFDNLDITINERIRKHLAIDTAEDNKNKIAEFPNQLIATDTKQPDGHFIPYYELDIAAGGFGKTQTSEDFTHWISSEDIGIKPSKENQYFISQIHGHSMEDTIPDGSYCLFRYGVVGSRNNRIVLCKKEGYIDPETDSAFTIKRYFSKKQISTDGDWRHLSIELRPDNSEYPSIFIEEDSASDFEIIAEFIRIVD